MALNCRMHRRRELGADRAAEMPFRHAMMKIREATKEHAQEIVRKVAALIGEIGGKAFVHDEAAAIGFIRDAMAQGRYLAFLAIDEGGNVVGILTLGESVAVYAAGRFGVILEFYVDPAVRSRGVGRMLLEKAKQKSALLNWSRLEVSAPPSLVGERAKGFYGKEGFQDIGPRLKWVARISEV